ncbi:MAG: hypothetical protein J6S96_09595 [Muribaculaceae bacterium]|nr:hypothetical protein [Muribaculaceae bacterium]
MFINLSNHPASEWSDEQMLAAERYGKVVDMPFPQVDSGASADEVEQIANDCVNRILAMGNAADITVHVMGEMTLVYNIVISLKRHGVRCVASTTERMATVLPDGTKQSKFHFAGFREYGHLSAQQQKHSLGWLSDRLPKWLSQQLYNKNTYSFAAIVILLVAELTAIVLGRHGSWCWLIALGAFFLASIVLLWLIARHHRLKFRISSEIMTRLLANTIAPQKLGVFFLLAFVIHLGWVADTVLYLLTPGGPFADIALPFATSVAGLLTLIVFFPDGRKRKSDTSTLVYVSGISNVTTPRDNVYKNLTLRPLVRVLQDAQGDCEMLILLSDFTHTSKNDITDGINAVLNFIGSSSTVDAGMHIHDQLRLVIREVARREFPEKRELIDRMPINFTDPCNYNIFSQCFTTLSSRIKELDDSAHRLAFNLSPGTGVVSSLMTLMAINADRDLYYYSQDASLPDDLRLIKIDKARVSLHNLLSQALENVAKGD